MFIDDSATSSSVLALAVRESSLKDMVGVRLM